MMRAMGMALPPAATSAPTATLTTTNTKRPQITLQFVDNAVNETAFTVQRATSAAGPWATVATLPQAAGSGTTVTWTDTTVARGTTYYYTVTANNVVGYTRQFAAPAVGYPTTQADAATMGPTTGVTTQ